MREMRAFIVLLKRCRLREAAAVIGGGAVYAALYALGSQIDQAGTVRMGESLRRFALAFPAALCILAFLMRFALKRIEIAADQKERRPFCTPLAFVLIFAGFVPLFLIEYPGSYMYDSQAQTFQIARNAYSMFHPLAHTLLLKMCLSLYGVFNSFEKCAAVCSLISMTVIAGCFALACASLSRSVSRSAARIALAFFCLYPSHMAFASNYTKDGMFAAFFTLFVALCAEEAACGGLLRLHRVMQIAAGTLACLFRNNMVYAMAVWTVILLAKRRRFLKMALCALLAIVLSRGVNAGLGALTDADRGSTAEMLSVPIQQLARARLYADEVFTPQERALMDEVCTYERYGFTQVWKSYTPTLADPVKNYLDASVLTERMDDLARMWARVGKERPDIYLDAFLHLALPSYYPYSEYRVAQPYIEIGIQPGVLTAPFGQPPMTQPGRFAGIRAWLYEHVYSTGMDDNPVLRWLFNTGFIFWVLLLFVLYDLYCGRWQRVFTALLPMLLWGTYLLGPVMQGRYLYPFVCILPIFAFRRKQDSIEGVR